MVEVEMTIPQLKLTFGKDRLGTGVWMWGWWRSGLTTIKLMLELMMELRIGDGSGSLGQKVGDEGDGG